MIYLFTGLPGAGKTLNALDFVINLQNEGEKKRKVYYANFQKFENGNAFDTSHPLFETVEDWQEVTKEDLTIDLPKLYDCDHPVDHGSIVFIDEAQDYYPTRQKAAVPEHLKFFEKHRHTGVDFVIVTQKIRQIDIHLRSLVGEHQDFKRIMGRDAVRVKKLNRVMEGDDEKTAEILTSTKKYPKKYFGIYRSTTLDTHKKKLPKILLLFPVILLFIVGMVFWLYSSLFSSHRSPPPAESQTLSAPPVQKSMTVMDLQNLEYMDPSQISREYRVLQFDLTERVKITDGEIIFSISKTPNCAFHDVFGFFCHVNGKFILARGVSNEKNDDGGPSTPF